MKALFFDTETNGIKTWDNPDFRLRLVQLGAILQDTDTKRVLGELNLISKQGGYEIPAGASNVHGITTELANEMGIDHDTIDFVFAQLIARADVIVAHNVQYDLDVITEDMPFSHKALNDKPTFCTMQGSLYIVRAPLSERQKAYFTSKGRMPEAPYKVPTLTETHQHFYGKPFVGAHDAMADIRACRDIFFTLIDECWYEIKDDQMSPTGRLLARQEAK